MGIRLRQLQFDVQGASIPDRSVLDAVVALSDESPVNDFGVQIPEVPEGPLMVTAQHIQALCETHGIPCRIRTSSAEHPGAVTIELRMGSGRELAERFGAAVREQLEQERLRVGVVVTLSPKARALVLDRIQRRLLTPLPEDVHPAWGCAVQLLDGMGMEHGSVGSITQWTP